ncbi:MAG: ACP S-malonyltransferase [Gammaproteobacteria bacterium]
MKTAIIFPGQGSQSMGMLGELAQEHPGVEQTFSEASDALGFDLWTLVQSGPEAELNATANTQPALLAAGVAVWRVWQHQGGAEPAYMAGHSLGEYTALVCAGALGFEDAIRLVADRGRFMQEAVPPGEGAMAAVLGLSDDQVRTVCAEATGDGDEVVSAANFNSPGQVVIAGSAVAVDSAIGLAKAAGAKRAVKLSVSVPSHCALMRPAAQRLEERLADIEVCAPAIPVIHNVDLESHRNPDDIRTALVAQLYESVQWSGTVRLLGTHGVAKLIEAGPGKVLSGLTRRIDRGLTGLPVYDPGTLAAALAA